MSTRTPVPPGMLKAVIFPADGVKRSGCSALMRHSMACPRNCTGEVMMELSFSPAAIRICDLTRSTSVIISVTGMLHLDAGVHLHERQIAFFVHEELDRPRVHVANVAEGLHQKACRCVRAARASPSSKALLPPASDGGAGYCNRARPDSSHCRAHRPAPGIRCGVGRSTNFSM